MDDSQDDKPEKEQYNSGDASTAKKDKTKRTPEIKDYFQAFVQAKFR